MSLVFTNLPYSTRTAHIHASSAHNVFSKRDMGDLVRTMRNVVAPAAHEHILRSELMFYH